MIKKKYVKSHNRHKITFVIPQEELPEDVAVETVAVVGDFDSWDAQSHLMTTDKKGGYKVTVELEPAEQYQFRYLANGTKWFNAWNADAYKPNEMGDDNCILKLGQVGGFVSDKTAVANN
jgi:hypothetical protein